MATKDKAAEEPAALGQPPAKQWPELEVSGCADPTISHIVKGTFRAVTMNHNKPVYKKYEKAKGLDVLVYFWDDRDGLELCGWWFGPQVGGDQVWAFHPSRTSQTPPANEWNIPNDGAIDPTFSITPRPLGSGKPEAAEAKKEAAVDDDVRKQLEAMKKEREDFAAKMEEMKKRAEERKRREAELKARLGGKASTEEPPAKKSKTDAKAEEDRRRREKEAQRRREEERKQAEADGRQRREEERRLREEQAQKRHEERVREEEEEKKRRAERKKQEAEEQEKRRQAEEQRRKEEKEQRRKEEAKRQEERQRRLNAEAKKRKEEIAVLAVMDAMQRMAHAKVEDFDCLKVMMERAIDGLLPYTGKQKATLRTEAARVLKCTEAYIRVAEEQQQRWQEWHDLAQAQ